MNETGSPTTNLNDCLENVHYFPDEEPFLKPFTDSNKKDSSHPYQVVESNDEIDGAKPCHEIQNLPRPLNKNVHFADE